MADPLVSVVMPVRDGERYIGEALASVENQTFPPSEVIVIDDGSTDRSADIAESYGARVIRTPPRGVSAARNAGVAEARGDVIAFIDHDDLWEPHKLERQVAPLRTQPELSLVLCWLRVLVMPETRRPRWVREEHLTQGFMTFGTGALVARREAFDIVGPFASDLELAEDADWMMRAYEAGLKRAVVDEALVQYRIHGGNTTILKPVSAPIVFHVLRKATARRAAAKERARG